MTKLLNRACDMSRTLDHASMLEEKQALGGLIDSMYTKLGILQTIDQSIVEITAEDALGDTILDIDDCIENVKMPIREMKTVSDNLYRTISVPSTGTVPDNMKDSVSNQRRTVNLPKLQLPKFDGNLLKWISFNDAFTAAIHNDDNLEDVHKFQHLICQLTDEAAHTIEGLQFTNSNYLEALLKKCYGQAHKIISCYMKALWELPRPNINIENIKDFYDNTESYIRGLRSLGKTEDAYGGLLVPIIFE